MTTTIRLILCGLALGALAGGLLCAQETPPRTTGRVLLLANERALEGDVRREGDQFCVRRGQGELCLPADRALCVCADWDEAFAVLKARADLRDPDERLRLARWCQRHGLGRQALEEAAQAVKMRPGHAESKHLLSLVQRAAAQEQAPPAAAKPTAAQAPPVPVIDISAESLAQFATKIQPLLMNACASCHTAGRGGEFRLLRCADATANRRATQHNLAAVLAQIHVERPEVSPLLVKAVSAHGSVSSAPLAGRKAPPFRLLQDWVHVTLANNPHLRPERAVASAAPGPKPAPEKNLLRESKSSEPAAAKKTTPPVTRPQPETATADAYSPALFNRQVHPKK